jgi:hypothetical protein
VAVKWDLKQWVLEAVGDLGGNSDVIGVARWIWTHHEADLAASGDLFYTWQYDMRWCAQELRKEGRLAPTSRGANSRWRLPTGAS